MRATLCWLVPLVKLDEDTQDRLYALGPHPAEVLTTDELRDLLEQLDKS